MNCPVCAEDAVKVLASANDCESVVRKKQCKHCGYIFYTEEYETKEARKHYFELDYERRRETLVKGKGK